MSPRSTFSGWIEPIKNLKVDVQGLLAEYQQVVQEHMSPVTSQNSTLVQRKFHLILMDEASKEVSLSDVPLVEAIRAEVDKLIEFNSITYRSILPNTCYNWHVDTGKNCVHVPLITSEGCWFVYENRCFRMPANGAVYLVNNERPHSFMNAGQKERLHLTFEKLSV